MKTILSLFLVLFAASSFYSQQTDTNLINSLKKGSWSIQFQVGNNFNLNTFEDVSISLKTHLSSKLAVRFGASLNANMDDQTISYKEYYYGYTGSNIPVNRNSLSFSLLAKMLYYFNPKSRINVYAGLGPLGTYSHNYYEYLYTDYYLEYLHDDTWSAGLNAIAGCEFFPVKYLSLLAEYSVTGTYSKSSRKDNVKQLPYGAIVEYRYVESTGFNFRGNTVRLGLSLYF